MFPFVSPHSRTGGTWSLAVVPARCYAPVSEYSHLVEGQRVECVASWEREAVASAGWRRRPNDDSLALLNAHHLEELQEVERSLATITNIAVQWHFRIASMRETGKPTGWLGSPEARRTPQPLPPDVSRAPPPRLSYGGF